MNLNKVIIIGRIVNDLEPKKTTNSSVISFSVATNKYFINKAGEKVKKTEYHRVVGFGRIAELIAQYSHKGDEILIEGELSTNKYSDKNGITKYSTEIIINNFQFGSKKVGNKTPEKAGKVPEIDINDLPL